MSEPKEPTDFEKFDKIMTGLMAVPYQELQKELARDRKKKAAKKKNAVRKASGRASSRDSEEASGIS